MEPSNTFDQEVKNGTFKSPPVTKNTSGDERTVGYEFEFTGVEMDLVAGIISDLYGGTVNKITTYEYEITDTDFGTFKLELDAQLLREKKYEKVLQALGFDPGKFKEKELFEDSLKDLASSVVPYEIITPPVPLSSMKELNTLVGKLREHKAEGTGSSIRYAFGLHINPEIPDKRAKSLLNHLRAFILLEPWIRKSAEINISRRITPYINEYTESYIQLILDPLYSPDIHKLIKDYFGYDNSRNRPLDMLPVFMYMDKNFTSDFLKDTLTSSRPTYHYRLPNCSLEDQNWSLAKEWNRWVLVEKLADDELTLNQYSRARLKMRKETLIGFETKWIEFMNRWVQNAE